MGLADSLLGGCGLILSIIAFVPLIIVTLIANPIVISSNWGNPCATGCLNICLFYLTKHLVSNVEPALWLTIDSVIILGLSTIALIAVLIVLIDGWKGDDKKKCKKSEKVFHFGLIPHGLCFYGFLIGWTAYGGTQYFNGGPWSACASSRSL